MLATVPLDSTAVSRIAAIRFSAMTEWGCVMEGNIAATALGYGMHFVQVEKEQALVIGQLNPLHRMIEMFGWA
jgi:hypothetical protein